MSTGYDTILATHISIPGRWEKPGQVRQRKITNDERGGEGTTGTFQIWQNPGGGRGCMNLKSC